MAEHGGAEAGAAGRGDGVVAAPEAQEAAAAEVLGEDDGETQRARTSALSGGCYEPSRQGYSPSARKLLASAAEDIKAQGNTHFKSGDFAQGIPLYSRAIAVCPRGRAESAAYYANRGACRLKMEDYEECAADCGQALKLRSVYPKVSLRRAIALEKLERFEESLEDYKVVLQHDSKSQEAKSAVQRLPAQIKEHQEKMQAEMWGSLKKLGNMCLNPFGFSTENFKMEQNPDTGGYSVNFKQ